jgi:hypothetical protein
MPEQPFENDSAEENSPGDDDEVNDDQEEEEEVYSIKIDYLFIVF